MLNAVIESDLSYIEQYTASTSHKVKKLLGVIAESVPFKPNIASLARKLDVSRDSIYAWLSHLKQAKVLNLLMPQGKGLSTLQKPEKIYLENTNLSYVLKARPDEGSLRETFLFNQLINSGLDVRMPKKGDFYVDGTYLEVGGKTKGFNQVHQHEDYLVAADNIETGFDRKVPLWLFGFLY